MSKLDEIHKGTPAVYQRNAKEWDKHRSRSLFEKNWLDRFVNILPSKANVLDVGCGAGEPIANYLIERSLRVTGIDSSQAMIKICKSRFPGQSWIEMDMRKLTFPQKFNGIIAWDSFFHLKQNEQRSTLQLFLEHLARPGVLLLTVGHEAGEVIGTVEGEDVYHSSLSLEEYQDILEVGGLKKIEMIIQDETCGGRTVLLAS